MKGQRLDEPIADFERYSRFPDAIEVRADDARVLGCNLVSDGLHVFLDDVTEFNGPLHFITGSHRHGVHETFLDTETTSYDLWCVNRDVVARLGSEGELFAATGPAGTGLIFGDLLVHSSPPNLSPHDRRIFSLILNPVANAYTRDVRPEWKHHRSLAPVATRSGALG